MNSPGKPTRVRVFFRNICLCYMAMSALLMASVTGSAHAEGSSSSASIASGVSPNQVLFPSELGKITDHFSGKKESGLVFLIAESHVSLPVQRAVVSTLLYLRNVYGVRIVCSEGLSGPLPVPPLPKTLSVRRNVAESALLARNINAVEYMAIAFRDIQVIGVEDMNAYESHHQALTQAPEKLKKWLTDLQSYLVNEVGSLPSTEKSAEQLTTALRRLEEDRGFDSFIASLYEIVGRSSQRGGKLTVLEERWRALREDPWMSLRDRAMALGTMATLKENHQVALVVGSLHRTGLQSLLREAGISYVTILVAGVPEDLDDYKPSEDEREVYDKLMRGDPLKLEKWPSHLKPRPALLRETFGSSIAIRAILEDADYMLGQGQAVAEIKAAAGPSLQRYGLQIGDAIDIKGGHGILLLFQGKIFYAYFTDDASAIEVPAGVEKIDEGNFGSRSYVLLDGGDGKRPPIPPVVDGAEDGRKGGDNSDKVYVAAIKEQQEQNPEAVTFRLRVVGRSLVRWLGGRRQLLAITADELRERVKKFRQTKPGPERILAAQRLSEVLFLDLDPGVPPGASILFQISEDDLLGDLSLPYVASLAGDAEAQPLAAMSEVYFIPWERSQENLEVLSRRPEPVDIRKTTVWISDALQSSAQFAGIRESMRQGSIRVNEELVMEDTFVLIGSGKDETITLLDGTKVSTNSSKFQDAIRNAGSVVTLNFTLASRIRDLAKQVKSEKVAAERSLARGLELVQEIGKSSGRESIDRVQRRRGASRRKEFRESQTLKSALENISVEDLGAAEVDAVATEISEK